MENSTQHIFNRLLMAHRSLKGNKLGELCMEAADRLAAQYGALDDLVQDMQNFEHRCQDTYCPVDNARRVLSMGIKYY